MGLKHRLLPYVEKVDRDLGKAWSFDTAEVVRWLEKRAADTAAEKLGVSGLDGKTSEEEAKRRRGLVPIKWRGVLY